MKKALFFVVFLLVLGAITFFVLKISTRRYTKRLTTGEVVLVEKLKDGREVIVRKNLVTGEETRTPLPRTK